MKSETAERAQQYTKKPVTIWAFRYNGNNAGDVLFWIGSSDAAIAAVPNRLAFANDAGDFLIRTLESGEGYHVVSIGDFVIQGISGEFYPCKPDIFAKTYELGERAIAESQAWISVEEKLPEIGTRVLAWKPQTGHDLVAYSLEADRHRAFIRQDGQWWDNGNRITHWMPLTGPKGNENV